MWDGYMYKSLCDLTTETTLEQKAEKLREEIASIVKKWINFLDSLNMIY